jgi:hypothetical protein
MEKQGVRLHFEELETRTLLTAASPAHPAGVAVLAAISELPPAPVLSGTITGNYTVPLALLADVGSTYDLQGKGPVAWLGKVTASGSFEGPGFVAFGHATGMVTLTNSQGTLALRLSGPLQQGFAAPPDHFYFTVWGGTGAFRRIHVSGRIDIHLNPAPPPVSPFPGVALHWQPHGTFTMTIHQWVT